MSPPVALNVGGHIYTTSLSTLTSYPDSMLGAMFSGDIPTGRDDQGRYFIDRDGELFRFVLNFLRTTELLLPDDFKEISQLKKEADFYQIQPLIEELRKEEVRAMCPRGEGDVLIVEHIFNKNAGGNEYRVVVSRTQPECRLQEVKQVLSSLAVECNRQELLPAWIRNLRVSVRIEEKWKWSFELIATFTDGGGMPRAANIEAVVPITALLRAYMDTGYVLQGGPTPVLQHDPKEAEKWVLVRKRKTPSSTS
ncbi:BTB/POZ domain-containing protein KCTD15-like [Branchiostoma floridae]|uniref:BTB/POZ domain-containing protein KCTD15-like n=2 Tax=Branchiostoma floridae TaxID=7739 RepID=A0A9J7L9P5_BRAFL|nr:BTB/POZ domain-containing protein KCTD15-like [Branchiostoma floridae]